MKIDLSFECPICKGIHHVKVSAKEFKRFVRGDELVQDIFPSPKYTAIQREQIISSLCPACQKEIFG